MIFSQHTISCAYLPKIPKFDKMWNFRANHKLQWTPKKTTFHQKSDNFSPKRNVIPFCCQNVTSHIYMLLSSNPPGVPGLGYGGGQWFNQSWQCQDLRDSILSTKMLVANITSVVAADFIFFAAELHCPGFRLSCIKWRVDMFLSFWLFVNSALSFRRSRQVELQRQLDCLKLQWQIWKFCTKSSLLVAILEAWMWIPGKPAITKTKSQSQWIIWIQGMIWTQWMI